MAKGLNPILLLKHLDTNNMEIYEFHRNNENDRKELDRDLAYILPYWMSNCVNASDQVKMTLAFNKHVNLDWKELNAHPELRAKVLAAVGVGKQIKHEFHVRAQQPKQDALMELLSQKYLDIRKEEVLLWCQKNSEKDLIEFCHSYGVQSKEMESIVNIYRKSV